MKFELTDENLLRIDAAGWAAHGAWAFAGTDSYHVSATSKTSVSPGRCILRRCMFRPGVLTPQNPSLRGNCPKYTTYMCSGSSRMNMNGHFWMHQPPLAFVIRIRSMHLKTALAQCMCLQDTFYGKGVVRHDLKDRWFGICALVGAALTLATAEADGSRDAVSCAS